MQITDTLAFLGFISSIIISSKHLLSHLLHYYQPHFQLYICRIILFIPIYSTQSYLSLKFPGISKYLEFLRDCYEAYLLATFLHLLINYLGGEDEIVLYFESKEKCNHPWPFNFAFDSLTCDRNFYWKLKRGVAQFIIFKPLTAAVSLFIYHDINHPRIDFSWKDFSFYLMFINHISTGTALYNLLLFYLSTREKLQPFSPFSKFLCIKAVLFFSFWQAFYIYCLVKWNIIKINSFKGKFSSSSMIQDWLICIELPFIALAHVYTFPHQAFSTENRLTMQPLLKSFKGIIKVDDVIEDTHEAFFKTIVQKEYKLKELD